MQHRKRHPARKQEEANSNLLPTEVLAGWAQISPIATRKDLDKADIVGRSSSYEKEDPEHERYDPDFPVGFKLSSSPHAPTVWWRHEILDWMKVKQSKCQKTGGVA